MAAAIGAGLPVTEPTASMIVDIGGGTTEVAIISLATSSSRSPSASRRRLRRGDRQPHEAEYNLLIGEQTAEEIKIEIGSAAPLSEEAQCEIRGRDLVTALPKTVVLSSQEVRLALEEPLSQIVDAIKFDARQDAAGARLRHHGPRHHARRRRASCTAWTSACATRRRCRCTSPVAAHVVAVGLGRSLEEFDVLHRQAAWPGTTGRGGGCSRKECPVVSPTAPSGLARPAPAARAASRRERRHDVDAHVSSVTTVSGAAAGPLEWTFDGPAMVGLGDQRQNHPDLRGRPVHTLTAGEAANVTQVRPPTLAGWDFMSATVFDGTTGVQALVTGRISAPRADHRPGRPRAAERRRQRRRAAAASPAHAAGLPEHRASPLAGRWSATPGSTLYTSRRPNPDPAFTFTAATGPSRGAAAACRTGLRPLGPAVGARCSNATSQPRHLDGAAISTPATGVLISTMGGAATASDDSRGSVRLRRRLPRRLRGDGRRPRPVHQSHRDLGLRRGRPTAVGSTTRPPRVRRLAYRPNGACRCAPVHRAAHLFHVQLAAPRRAGRRVVDNSTPPLPRPGFINGLVRCHRRTTSC